LQAGRSIVAAGRNGDQNVFAHPSATFPFLAQLLWIHLELVRADS
jgi:hypothetical protein